MAPAILIVGATGNTGRGVTQTLPQLLKDSKTLSGHRIIALTRSANSDSAQRLAKIPGVEIVEQNWTDITPEWLSEHQVVRAFIASHNAPNQFAEESSFHVAALNAGLEYVVRISTTAANVRPDCRAYYPRTHWAIESMLGSDEFSNLKWTSLQPNVFTELALAPATAAIKHFKETGNQAPLSLMFAEHAPVAPVDPAEVGAFAARLLAADDPNRHNGAKYVLNGPEDITGRRIVEMIEERTGTKVFDVNFQDISFIDGLVASGFGGPGQSKTVLTSIKYALATMWEGKAAANTTSKEVRDIGAPKRTPSETLDSVLKE
ncbi:hypothetical protein FVEN_g12259 [Fusarium venenatum]|uniref:NmrA-like domain-containing protein n=1 Tax=Fusarium venenatum TaxID=56646 RepID=A0A2L2U1S7_9HYPO|nr:uncharacterized protein FVRRES_08212 [Fusarium venenatum]KAG8349559.1 hypothetical protein FVEN_g12259 [Fusarium venenatum]KAH6965001.1 NmrA-like family protein [Fusarium venenatum]CEI68135.1 unnamed protein product [Fusarium venenatum]